MMDLLEKEVKKRNSRVNKRLTYLMNEDKTFTLQFKLIYDYYHSKLVKTLGKKVSKHEDFTDQYFMYITNLFYQGYYLGLELIDNTEVNIVDRFYQQPNGIIKEQVYNLLEGATGDLVSIVSDENGQKFENPFINENETAALIFIQLKKDISSLGTLQAILDQRNKLELTVTPEQDNQYKGLIARSDDLFFVDPQKYLICVMTDGKSEKWDLCLWSSLTARNNKIGEVHVSMFDVEDVNKTVETLPYYQGLEAFKRAEKSVSISLICNDTVEEKEQLPIIQSIIENVKQRLNLSYDSITVSFAVTSNITTYQYEEPEQAIALIP